MSGLDDESAHPMHVEAALRANSEKVQAELTSIVDAEAVCCSFFDLSVHPDGERLILAISAPPDAMPVVRDLTASFQGEQPTG